MNKYRLSTLAFQDLEEIADYVGERNPAAAVKLLDRLFESFRLLAESPMLGEKRDDLPGRPRVFSVGNYLIAYLRAMFTVKDIDEMVTRLQKRGAKLVGEIVQYKDTYRLCYIRGPEGLLIGLAEELPEK